MQRASFRDGNSVWPDHDHWFADYVFGLHDFYGPPLCGESEFGDGADAGFKHPQRSFGAASDVRLDGSSRSGALPERGGRR